MAESKAVNPQDIIKDGLFKPTITSAEQALVVLDAVEKKLREVKTEAESYLKTNKGFKSNADVEVYLQTIEKLNTSIENLNKVTQKRVIVERTIQAQTKKTTKEKQVLTAQEIKQRELDKKESRERTQRLKQEAILESQSAGLKEKLQARNSLLRMEVNKLTGAEENYEKRLKSLNDEIDTNASAIDGMVDKQTKQRNNVGGYTAAINEAAGATGVLGQAFQKSQQILGVLNESYNTTVANITALRTELTELRKGKTRTAAETDVLNTATGNYTSGVKKAALGTKIFNNVLKAGVIGSIITLVAGAASFFSKFESGLDSLDKFSGRFTAIFGVLADRFGNFFKSFLGFFGAVSDGFTKIGLNIKKFSLEAQQFLGKDVGAELTEIENKLEELNKKTSAGEFLKQMRESFAGVSAEIKAQIALSDALVKRIDDYGRTARLLALRIANISELEKEYSAIVSDQTKSFKDQEEAQERLMKLSNERAELELSNAKELFEQEIGKIARSQAVSEAEIRNAIRTQTNTEKVREKDLSSLLEFQKDVIAAEGELNMVRVNFNQKRRETEQKAFLNTVKITEEQSKIQLKNIEDIAKSSENTFENRLLAEQKYGQESNKIFENLGAKFQERTKEQIDLTDLLNTVSALDLEEKIRALNLDKKTEAQLSNLITNRKQELEVISELTKARKADQKAIEERNKAALNSIEQENAKFEIDAIKQRGELTKSELNEVFNLRKQALENQANFELQNDKLTADEKLVIANKLENDLIRLGWERETETEKQLAKELDLYTNLYREITKTAQNAISAQSRARSQAFEQETRELNRQQNLQAIRAANGLENTLAFQEQKAAEAEVKNQERLKREQKAAEVLQLTEAFYTAYNGFLKEDPNTAISKATASTFGAKGVAQGLFQYFAEGTDFITQKGGKSPFSKGRDTVPIMAEVGEAVLTRKANLANPDVAKSLNNGTFKDVYERKGSSAENMYLSMQMLSEIKKLNSKPVQQIAVDSFGNIIERTYKAGQTSVITHKNRFAKK